MVISANADRPSAPVRVAPVAGRSRTLMTVYTAGRQVGRAVVIALRQQACLRQTSSDRYLSDRRHCVKALAEITKMF
jgi:hypothetical protein